MVYLIVSVLLAFAYVGAISQNIGKDYWHVFKGTYFVTLFLVIIGSAALLFATAVITPHNIYEGRGGFLALVIVYIIAVAILGPVIYFGLLNFEGL